MIKYCRNKSYLNEIKKIFLGIVTCALLVNNNLSAMKPVEEEFLSEIIKKSSSPTFVAFFFQHTFRCYEYPLHFLEENNIPALERVLQEIFCLLDLEISFQAKEFLLSIINHHEFYKNTILQVIQERHSSKVNLIKLLIESGAYITIKLTTEEKKTPVFDRVDVLSDIRDRILKVQQQFPKNGIIVDLSHFRLSEIPNWFFEGLTNVIELNFRGNQLTQKSINCICRLPNLQILDLSLNNLTDFSVSIFGVGKLERLYLSKNQLTQEVVDHICRLTNLKVLDLSSNNLTSIPFGIGGLTRLEEFDFSRNHLTLDAIDFFLRGQFSNLRRLFLVGYLEKLKHCFVIDQLRERGVQVFI